MSKVHVMFYFCTSHNHFIYVDIYRVFYLNLPIQRDTDDPILSSWPFLWRATEILISLCPSFLFSYVVWIEFSQRQQHVIVVVSHVTTCGKETKLQPFGFVLPFGQKNMILNWAGSGLNILETVHCV